MLGHQKGTCRERGAGMIYRGDAFQRHAEHLNVNKIRGLCLVARGMHAFGMLHGRCTSL